MKKFLEIIYHATFLLNVLGLCVGCKIPDHRTLNVEVSGEKKLYQLASVVTHEGSPQSGHYRAYLFSDVWWEYDDNNVSHNMSQL